MKRRATNPDGTKAERRKSQRFPVSVPIEASWLGPDGRTVKEDAIARQVNLHGGHLEMASYPEVGSRISLMNVLSAQTAEARVLATPYSREGVSQGIIVELVAPNESFWGVNLQVKKTSVELQKLEDSLRTEGIDLRLLKEFRDAIDHMHLTAQVVQRLRDLQVRGRDNDEVLSLLTAERLRRATNLCSGVLADLDAGKVNAATKGAEEFYRCLEQIYSRLRDSLEPTAVSTRSHSKV